jgi:hypothetical protein
MSGPNGYSQLGEEAVIQDFFKGAVKSFLDLGAGDGETFSNTRKLMEQGWSGICIEGSIDVFPALLSKCRFPKVQLVHAVVNLRPAFSRLVTFHDHGGLIATLDPAHKEKWEKNGNAVFRSYSTPSISIEEMFAIFPPPHAFVNVDIEGVSVEAVLRFPNFAFSGMELLCVELDGEDQRGPLSLFMERHGFVLHHKNDLNIFYRRN